MKLRPPYLARLRSGGSKGSSLGLARRSPPLALLAQVDELRADGWGASDLEALQEFVADDGTDWPDGLADPVFKERLRMDAWWMIVSRRRTPTYGTLQR